MKKSKLLKALCGVCAVGMMLTACGGTTTESTPADASGSQAASTGKTLTYWSMWNSTEGQAKVIQEAADAYEAATGIKINIEWKGRDINQVLSASLEAGDNVDIFEDDYQRIAQIYKDYTLDLTEMAEAAGYTGYDCINNYAPSAQLADFLGAFADSNELPRTIVYSLNPADDAVIESVIGCFQNSDAVGKVQHGSAWWFNDHIMGMRQQIMTLASQGRLAGFVGMLTDSRSFLSYPRHEYFRRILCDYLGDQVENGLFPDDRATLGRIVQDISYNNADHYFKFPRK